MKSALLVLLFLTGCASMGTKAPLAAEHFNRASSVRVSTELGHGSGVVVSDKCVLTADHVIKGAKHINIGLMMHVVKEADDPVDLALICADESIGKPVVKIGATPQIDDPVYVVGDPLSFQGVVTEGRYEDNDMITAPCAPGNSGGGAFNQAGELIGIVDAISGYPFDQGEAFFPHLATIIGVPSITSFLKGAI